MEKVRNLALALPETDEQPHFENIAIRVKQKVFLTINAKESRATVRLTLEDQDIFTRVSKGTVFPVPNKWGKYGWTHVLPDQAEPELLEDLIQTAWRTVAPPQFKKKYPELYWEETE